MPAPADIPWIGAEEDQQADVLRERAADRGEGEDREAGQHDRPASEAVGQGAVEEVHDGEAEQVGRERLLHLDRRRADRLGDAGEGRQVGVDRERPEHAEAGQEDGQGPAGACQRVRASGFVEDGRCVWWSDARRGPKSVKRADRPDSVRANRLATIARDRHSSGPDIAVRLGATYPPARAEPHFQARVEMLAHAGLFGIAARRDCPFHPTGRPRGRPIDSSLLL